MNMTHKRTTPSGSSTQTGGHDVGVHDRYRTSTLPLVAGVAAFATTVASVHADFFQVEGEGAFAFVDINPRHIVFTFDAGVLDQIGPYGFTSVVGEGVQTFTLDPIHDDLAVNATLFGPDPGDTIAGSFEGLFYPGAMNGTSAGVWEVTGATGIYAGLVGGGVFSSWNVVLDQAGGILGFTIQGDLVPAPGVLAAMGLGTLVLTRRRR